MFAWVDIALLLVLLLSGLYSMLRGFAREAISMAGWFIAFWAAVLFSPTLADSMSGIIVQGTVRTALAFVGILIGVLLCSSLVARFSTKLLDVTHLRPIDRIIGLLFGLLRGGLIVMVLIVLGDFSSMAVEDVWQQSIIVNNGRLMMAWLMTALALDFQQLWQQISV